MRLSVVVLVAVALLQPVSSQHETQETEENHSIDRGRDQLTVLNLDHYLLLLNNKLDTLSSKVEQLHTIVSQHKQQTAAELFELRDTMTAAIARLSTDLREIKTNISSMECMNTEDTLQLHHNLHDNLTYQLEAIADGVYASYTCGGTRGWRRVVYLDMAYPSATCPSGWNMTGYSKRTCGRATDGPGTCDSVTFPVSGGEYSRVCGRVKAYQWGAVEAFHNYHRGYATTIDSTYVNGVSVTHGSPRQHIWTFAAGAAESNPARPWVCPCDADHTIHIPPFVGDDYFCESGVNELWGYGTHRIFHSSDPLWDGENCLSSSTCCSLHNPPYFVKQLLSPTTDDIEARICLTHDITWANIAIELIDLYVQ